jgi:hypothetical protein
MSQLLNLLHKFIEKKNLNYETKFLIHAKNIKRFNIKASINKFDKHFYADFQDMT